MYTSVHSNLRDQNEEMTSSWDLVFICNFNDRELESEDWFFDILYSSLPNSEKLDSMSWNLMSNRQFDARSCYVALIGFGDGLFPWKSIWCLRPQKELVSSCGR